MTLELLSISDNRSIVSTRLVNIVYIFLFLNLEILHVREGHWL